MCARAREGFLLKHAAGSGFARSGVGVGDIVYVVNVQAGRLRLIGRMQIGRIVSDRTAGPAPWQAVGHCIAAPGTASVVRRDRFVPVSVVRRLRFVRRDGLTLPPTFKARQRDLLSQRTFQSVRRLTLDSARLLDDFLAAHP